MERTRERERPSNMERPRERERPSNMERPRERERPSNMAQAVRWGVDAVMAVYTEVSFEELERLLERYDIGQPLSFKGIAEGIENSNFYLQTDRGAFILTLYEKRVAAEDLPFFL